MADLAPVPTVPIRLVAINVALAVFVAIVVYAVATLGFVMPRMQRQEQRLGQLSAQLAAVQESLASAQQAQAAAPTPPPAPAPAATAAAPAEAAAK